MENLKSNWEIINRKSGNIIFQNHFCLTAYTTYTKIFYLINISIMEFKNPITALQAIDDVADNYEIESVATNKQSETIVYWIALLVEDNRIHAKFIVTIDTEQRRITTIRFIPHEDLPQLGYFELVWSEISNFIQFKPSPISRVLQLTVLQKLVKIIC